MDQHDRVVQLAHWPFTARPSDVEEELGVVVAAAATATAGVAGSDGVAATADVADPAVGVWAAAAGVWAVVADAAADTVAGWMHGSAACCGTSSSSSPIPASR